MNRRKHLFRLFASGLKPKDIVKDKLTDYSKVSIYWNYRQFKDKEKNPFIVVE